jgi:diguanylate cyclase (GGDEF)-like protein
LIGRLGGEEFAIVLPRTEHAQAFLVAQRVCQQVSAHAFTVPQAAPLHITLSVGLHAVGTTQKHDSIDHLLSKADQALYTAKRSGRNQVRQYGPSLAPSAI